MRSTIEQQVMAGVAAIYVARKLTGRTALECYTLFLSSFCLTLFVSLHSVAANFESVAGSGFPSLGVYLFSAVLGTKLIVQVALVIGLVAIISIGRDVIRSTMRPSFA